MESWTFPRIPMKAINRYVFSFPLSTSHSGWRGVRRSSHSLPELFFEVKFTQEMEIKKKEEKLKKPKLLVVICLSCRYTYSLENLNSLA